MMLHRRPIAVGCHTMAILCLIFVYPRCGAQPPEDQCPNNFSPSTVTVIIFGLITAFFFLTYFAFYVRQCAAGEDAASAADRRDELRLGSAVGLSLDILKSFPTMPYTEAKALKLGHGDLECAVCLMEFEDDEDLRMLPGCCHVFHPDCIDAWFAAHVTCPVCRSDLATAAALESPIPPASSPSPPIPESPPDTVILVVDRDRAPEEDDAIELTRIGKEKREARSRRGRRPSKLPRSHTTGHSLAKLDPEAVGDRYTLRLPEHIRQEIFAARKFHRSTSCVALPVTEEGSSRAGYRCDTGGEGSSGGVRSWILGKSDRWPSLFRTTLSVPWKRGDGDASAKKAEASTAVS
ncbi:E3 ubiquitin-protein ligase ATL6-like [Curcuma longa]|uniref:E3 ubiquitin-protein ligase ATL6-like n=1 Tax=Curcuma longa TaxID=136217 RepID=UPI003D9E2719